MDTRKVYQSIFYFNFLLLVLPVAAENSFIEKIAIDLEKKQMRRLSDTKKIAAIKTFTTDGCSGGMSSGWKYFALKFPLFSKHLHKQPPWLPCCVIHDRAYWQGTTQNGFSNRLRADQALKNCIIQQGVKISPKIAKKYNINETQIRFYFQTTANLVYKAVRLGGGPCTPFEWRWGYGWPTCK